MLVFFILGRKVYWYRELEGGKGSKKISIGKIMWNILVLNLGIGHFMATLKDKHGFKWCGNGNGNSVVLRLRLSLI